MLNVNGLATEEPAGFCSRRCEGELFQLPLASDRMKVFVRECAKVYDYVIIDTPPINTVADAQIAAICRARGATCATRNVKDFAETGVELIDPWAA